jgi:tetratricopeptide (TPR) repeat protein
MTLGTVATVVLLEVALVLSHRAFVAWQASTAERVASGAEQREIRILAIGESTTAVAGNTTNTLLVPGTAWPAQLEAVLHERQDTVRFEVVNAAVMGGNSAAALDLMHDALDRVEPDMIVAMMGIMDTPGDTRDTHARVPDLLSGIRTVQLVAWLVESVRIRQSRAVAEARTVADLPRSGRDGSLMPVGRPAFELRMRTDPVALDQLEVANYLMHTGFSTRSEQILRDLVADRDLGHAALAHLLLGLDRPDAARRVLDAAIPRHPEEGLYWVVRAEIDLRQGHIAAAEATLDEADARMEQFEEPELIADFVALERSAIRLVAGDPMGAIAAAEAARGGSDGNYKGIVPNVYLRREKAIGRAYIALENWAAAEHHLLAAMESQPSRSLNLMWTLTEVYRASGQTEKEAALREELLARTGRVGEYMELARLLRNQGDAETAKRVEADANNQTPSLREAYSHLYRTAQHVGAQVVVVQYPMFPLEPLERWAPPAPGVHHVDTQHIFDGVVAQSYADAGLPAAFSHYSKSGARRVAEAVADTVLDAYGLSEATP